ncbi:uncharacterized protein LOC115449457 [Manduca sexta]|uniref:Uncharacterized protein n=1 Tax=Manduca sexta TaxID=7130 RepID=A0A921ZMA4_MANSE|nr:uncharacterized protein LOC115449457 [Manduca sexta]KAG6459422.1 hypothetical protein O3G_MSEX011373 [Manduca sexta]
MSKGKWYTKEDVLKDLAVATGKVPNIDSSYLVVGERPPPQYFCEPDDEMELMFRDTIGEKSAGPAMSPDLRGITEMIRMVQGCDDSSSDYDTNVCTTRPKSPCDIISISKLNPNVQEFKPQDITACAVANKPEGNTSSKENKPSVVISGPTSRKSRDSESGKGDKLKAQGINKQTDINRNDELHKDLEACTSNAQEQKDKTSELRSKVQKPNQNGVSTFQVKKERNFAIANLQKLLSMQGSDGIKDTVENTVKPIKLLTPDYYEHSKAEAAEESESQNNLQHKPKIDDTPSNKSVGTSSKPSGSSFEVIKKLFLNDLNAGVRTSSDPGIKNINEYSKLEKKALSTASDNKTDISVSDEKLCSDTNLSDPQIRDSINKVNHWMNKNDGKPAEAVKLPEKAQVISPTPPVFLSSITFKRKETRKSPNVSEKTVARPSKNHIEQYKPSEYAQELSKMYTERVKKIESTKAKNSWANLEDLLKEKDEKIKQEKLKAQNEACDNK